MRPWMQHQNLMRQHELFRSSSAWAPVADLGGGDGGDASPPTSLKVTILAEKSASVSNNSAPFRDASAPPA